MSYKLLFSLFVMGTLTGAVHAQTTTPPASGVPTPKDCPPGVSAQRQNSDQPLSDKLASSNGVICPPAGVDPEIKQAPQSGGTIKVIPPPGSAGGDQSVKPK